MRRYNDVIPHPATMTVRDRSNLEYFFELAEREGDEAEMDRLSNELAIADVYTRMGTGEEW